MTLAQSELSGRIVALPDKAVVSAFGEVEVFYPVYYPGGFWIIPEWGFIPPEGGTNPIEWGRYGVVGWYPMSHGEISGGGDIKGGGGGGSGGGSEWQEAAITRLLGGTAQEYDCMPMAFGAPTHPREVEFLSMRFNFKSRPKTFASIWGDDYTTRWFICEVMKTWLGPATTCIPDFLKRCLAENWKKTRVWIQGDPCFSNDTGGTFKAINIRNPLNRDYGYIVICEYWFNQDVDGTPMLYELLMHELLHSCGVGELEAYAIVSHCMSPENTHWGFQSKGFADGCHGIPWSSVKEGWLRDTADESGPRIWWDKDTRRWYGKFIYWDCDTGEIWMKSSENGDYIRIFPRKGETCDVKPNLRDHGWECPEG